MPRATSKGLKPPPQSGREAGSRQLPDLEEGQDGGGGELGDDVEVDDQVALEVGFRRVKKLALKKHMLALRLQDVL
jgi:hypothetical protein